MSMESLQADFKEIETAAQALTGQGPVGDFINNMLVPFLANAVKEVAEMDEVLSDLIEQTEDILQPETARLIAGALAGGKVIADELRKRLTASEEDLKLKAVIDEFDVNAKESMDVIAEITIPEDEGDGDEDDDTEGEGDEDEDEE